jgi:5-deoxy-glucuronate isomerase
MARLLLRASDGIDVTPDSAGWCYISFRVDTLRQGEYIEHEPSPEEIALVPLSGRAHVQTSEADWLFGGRSSVFEGLAEVLYVPPFVGWTLTAESDLEIAVCGARSESRTHNAQLVTSSGYGVEVRGAANSTRRVATPLPPGFDADRLIVVEVWTPAGNWSSYPPHKHDQMRPPDEVALEEIFYYRTPKTDGFAVQRLYSPERGFDEAWTVRDGDLLLVPWGYHTTVAAPGHELYYLNVLAGETRDLDAYEDPAHRWVRDSWAGQEQDPRAASPGTAG